MGDTVLGVGSARVMPEVAQAMAWCGAAGAFDQPADTLTRLWQVAVDGETLRRVVEQVGTVAEARERAAMDAVASGPVPDPGPDGPVALIVETDGAMANFQDADPGWHEVKCGAGLALDPTGERLVPVNLCFGFEPRPEFWTRLTAHARRIGLAAGLAGAWPPRRRGRLDLARRAHVFRRPPDDRGGDSGSPKLASATGPPPPEFGRSP